MNQPLPREAATDISDLPHAYSQNVTGGELCSVCTAGQSDPRHLSWERAQVQERETAGQQILHREIGS